jgi:hypothetical protein
MNPHTGMKPDTREHRNVMEREPAPARRRPPAPAPRPRRNRRLVLLLTVVIVAGFLLGLGMPIHQ